MIKERVVLIDKTDDLCDNIGTAAIDLSVINPGKYKLYYLRIENEHRIIANSRLEPIGVSSTFSMNKINDNNNSAVKKNIMTTAEQS